LLKSFLLSEFGGSAPLERHELTATDIAGIRRLQESKYETWQWNYGESPAFNFSKKIRFPQGTVAVSLVVQEGLIRQCAINGDFLGCMNISDVEKALIGTRRQFTDVAACIAQFDAAAYFGGISADEVADCFLH
jgi:lipoate-protein ligase A